jgi:methylmalonyl-CoA mutase N-terminal domain/subunit
MDAEYSVIGRVARRIWAVAMKERYGAGERAQKLKYHVQTSGRSLHAQEMDFNDIRTTLQALCAIYDNCNSLHTNAFDEAVTTPSEHSVRRALAIQMIIDKEWGLAGNENPLQGSYIIEQLTDLVEEAVLAEFDRLAERGGVLGAMETGYQRGRIQDESMLYEQRKHDGSLPIVGVNTFLDPHRGRHPGRTGGTRPRHRGGKAVPARAARRLPRPARGDRAGGDRPAAGRRHQRRQRLRRADGRRPALLARADQRRLLRSGRPVPAQRVSGGLRCSGPDDAPGPFRQ